MKRLLAIIVISLAACLAVSPAIGAGLRLEAPERTHIGMPFMAWAISDEPIDEAVFTWRGRRLTAPVDHQGGQWRAGVLLGADIKYAKAGSWPVAVRVRTPGETRTMERTVTLYAKEFPEERLTVSSKMVNPPKEVYARIREESKAVAKALGTLSSRALWSPPFHPPVPGDVSSVYGLRRFFNNQPRSPHRGLDMNAALGEPVEATGAGRVVLTGNHYYAGNSVYIDHGLGLVSVYFHLSEILVHEGDIVEKGDRIGLVGATGRVTAPHLHFGMYILKHAVDPAPLFKSDFFTVPN